VNLGEEGTDHDCNTGRCDQVQAGGGVRL